MAEESLALTATLKQLAELDAYNRWLFDQFADCLGKRVLEVGAGTGNITQFLCAAGSEVVATDVLPAYRRELASRFAGQANVRTGEFDLTQAAPAEMVSAPFDTVVCLNVLEHIEDDRFSLDQMRRVLAPDGMLALLVPAHQVLYGEFDRAVGHYRRYEKSQLKQLLIETGFRIRSMRFFSAAATLPWLINGRLLKRGFLPSGQTGLANRLVPLLRLERFIGPPFGLSLIAVASKS
ncbi:MAG: methyltransferase [Acidobacteriota bacterium]